MERGKGRGDGGRGGWRKGGRDGVREGFVFSLASEHIFVYIAVFPGFRESSL